MDAIKLYLCDDHQLMLDGLKLIIHGAPDIEVVGLGTNGQEFLDWLTENNTDVVLLDINMPVLDGIKTARILQEKYPQIKIIYLSMINQSEIMSTLLRTGAKGFLMKNSSRDEVLKAIRSVASGGSHFDANILNQNEKKVKRIPNQYLPKLTSREKEVLQLIINEYTSPEIAKKLFVSLGTVETHRRNLISKLGVKNTAGLVRTAIEYQLV